MPIYYFDIRADGQLSQDEEGMELPDLDAVQSEAGRAMGEMARDELKASAAVALNMALEIRSQTGLVMKASFSFDLERLQ